MSMLIARSPDTPTELCTNPQLALEAMEFLDVLALGKQTPGQVVLLPNGYRAANPSVEAAAQEVRATLLHELTATSLTRIRMATAMKRVRSWPQDDGTHTMSSHVAGLVKEWMNLAFIFRVEDEASLDALLSACAGELARDQLSEFGKAANAWTGMGSHLASARDAAMAILAKWSIVPSVWRTARARDSS